MNGYSLKNFFFPFSKFSIKKYTTFEIFLKKDWDFTFRSHTLCRSAGSCLTFYKAVSHFLVCGACLCRKVKATWQHGENRPSLGVRVHHCAVCAHCGLTLAVPVCPLGFPPWHSECAGFCKALCSSKIRSLWFFPKLFNTLLSFYVPINHLIDPRFGGQTHFKIGL